MSANTGRGSPNPFFPQASLLARDYCVCKSWACQCHDNSHLKELFTDETVSWYSAVWKYSLER